MQRDNRKIGGYWKYDEDKIGTRTYKRKNKIEKKKRTNAETTLFPKRNKTVESTSENATITTSKIPFFLPKTKLSKEDMKFNEKISGAITIPKGKKLIVNGYCI